MESEKVKKHPRVKKASPNPNAFAFTIHDAQEMGAPGRTKIYELIAQGKLKSVFVGGRRLIVGASLRALLTDAA